MEQTEKQVVFGTALGYTVFLRREDVEHLHAFWSALARPTWGEALSAIRPVEPTTFEMLENLKHELEYRDDEPFDVWHIDADGEWPRRWPADLMSDWIPEEVAELGDELAISSDGPFLDFSDADLAEVVARLRKLGYRCTRDDQLLQSILEDQPYLLRELKQGEGSR